MIDGDHHTERSLRALLVTIGLTSERSFDVADLEPHLAKLLGLLRSAATDRPTAARMLADLAEDWPPGSVEAVEFTMRDLQWPEVRSALERRLELDADFRIKDQTKRVLEVFRPEWPGGDIYEKYRRRTEE